MKNFFLLSAGLLSIMLGISHSILGEKLILGPLFKKNSLPVLLGKNDFFMQTLRFTWHITTVLLIGIGTVLAAFSYVTEYQMEVNFFSQVLGLFFFVCFLVALIGSRGRHFSWIVFLLISILCASADTFRGR